MMTYIQNRFNRNQIEHKVGKSVGRCWLDPDDRWLLGLCLARIGYTLMFNTYAATQPLLMRDWHLSAAQAGWIHAGFYCGYLISLFGLGVLSDRYGAKRMILLSGIAASASAFLFAVFAQGFYSGLLSYGACALFLGGSYTPVLTVVSQRIAIKRRGRAIGWYIAAGALGYALSLYLSGVMMGYYGWRSAFYITACGPGLGTILLFGVLRHTPNSIAPRSPSPAEGNFRQAVLANKGAMLMILGYTCHSWELLGMRAWLPTFLTAAVAGRTGSGTQAASVGASIGAVLLATSMVGNISGGILSDRWGRTAVIILMSCLSLLCSFSIGWLVTMPLWLILLVALLYSSTSIGDSPVYSTALSELVPLRFLGAAYALRSVLGFGAGVVSPVVFGLVLDWPNGIVGTTGTLAWGLAFVSLGMGGLFGPLGMLWLRRILQTHQHS